MNLYPFERVAGRRGVADDEVIENIDIGGPTLIRAAAKNHAFVAVVVTPESYDAVLEELRERAAGCPRARARRWRCEAFAYTARYDAAISRWFAEREEDFPGAVHALVREGARPLLRREPAPARRLLRADRARGRTCCRWSRSSTARSCRSTTCSTSTPARRLVEEFELPAAAIIKHNNPCGAAVGDDVGEAFEQRAGHRSA